MAEQANASSPRYVAIGLASLRVAGIATAVSVAAGGESYSTATSGELWAILVLSVDAFLAASAMSAAAGAALRGAEALGLATVPAAMSGISDVPLCHVCRVCVLYF